MMNELLFEIGTEEIPSSYILPAVEALGATLAKRLTALDLPFDDIKTYSTPRRLTVCARGIPAEQAKKTVKVYGPSVKTAIAEDGSFTKAAIGFAKGKGAPVDAIRRGKTDKGEYIYVEIEEGGGRVADLLAGELPRITLGLSFPRSMRWGAGDIRFTRPIHWFVALLGGEVVKFSVDNVRSGAVTRGHRFLGSQSITVTGVEDYLAKLRENFVIADVEERKQVIVSGARQAARANGAQLLEDDELAETVACLTEWPEPLWGVFDEKFLALPEELLIASMKNHQKMFGVRRPDGKLANGFIGVSNMKVEDSAVVVAGYRRVLRARLADAEFFFREDRKKTLETFAEKLGGVTYQKKLGTVGQKVERFATLALYIADEAAPDARGYVERTARLCKADLETLMVYEFPELQGVMGREYARLAGEPPEVCDGIYEHYLPRYSGDALPGSDTGAIVGLADRMDTLAGYFGVGQAPTGARDPFALRRHALGVIQIIFDKRYKISLGKLTQRAVALLDGKLDMGADDVKASLMEFFATRLKNYWTGKGVPYDVADAVLSAGFDDISTANLRVEAMAELKKRDFFEPLAVTFKRAANITKGAARSGVDEALLETESEKELNRAVALIKDTTQKLVDAGSYLPALEKISGLRAPVDRFFDETLVMAEDEKLRANRLALLGELTGLLDAIADFSKIVT